MIARSRNIILYPHFILCSMLATNLYWKYVFNNLSKGIMPSTEIEIQDNKLCYRIKSKNKKLDLKEKHCFESNQIYYNYYYDFLKLKIGIHSLEKYDVENEQFYIKHVCNNKHISWKEIHKKSDIEFYIKKYIYDKYIGTPNVNYNKIFALIFYTHHFKKIYNSIIFDDEKVKIIDIPILKFHKDNVTIHNLNKK